VGRKAKQTRGGAIENNRGGSMLLEPEGKSRKKTAEGGNFGVGLQREAAGDWRKDLQVPRGAGVKAR